VANGRSVSINGLAELIVRITGASVPIRHAPVRAGDVKHSLADTGRVRAIGFAPRTTLEEGLKATIEDMKARRG